MDFIQEIGFDVRLGRERDYQAWLTEHLDELRAAYPSGTELLGVYITPFTSEPEGGWVRLLVRLDSYAALDRIAAAARAPGSPLRRLVDEHEAFLDPRHQARWANTLYKSVIDATIIPSHVEPDAP